MPPPAAFPVQMLHLGAVPARLCEPQELGLPRWTQGTAGLLTALLGIIFSSFSLCEGSFLLAQPGCAGGCAGLAGLEARRDLGSGQQGPGTAPPFSAHRILSVSCIWAQFSGQVA